MNEVNEITRFINLFRRSVEAYRASETNDKLFKGWVLSAEMRLTQLDITTTMNPESINEIYVNELFLDAVTEEFKIDDFDPYGFRDEIVECFEKVYEVIVKHQN